MLAIKLQRIGKKHQPSYRIVVAEKRSKLDGRAVEDIGWWNPREKKHSVEKERVAHWISVGAKPTDTVFNLLVTAGVLTCAKRPNFKLPKKPKAEEAAKTAEKAVA